MTIRSTVYLDPGVDDAIIAELERMPFRRRAGRLVQLLRTGAETSLRQRDGTLRGGLVRCRTAPITSSTRVRIGIRLSGPADAAVMQLLAESPNRRTERLRQLAQCGLEREAYWAQQGVQAFAPDRVRADRTPVPLRVRPDPMLMIAGLHPIIEPERTTPSARDAHMRNGTSHLPEMRWYPTPTGTPCHRIRADSDD
jgi:hypothetical protein